MENIERQWQLLMLAHQEKDQAVRLADIYLFKSHPTFSFQFSMSLDPRRD